jgi:hypothetical protein
LLRLSSHSTSINVHASFSDAAAIARSAVCIENQKPNKKQPIGIIEVRSRRRLPAKHVDLLAQYGELFN